MRPLDGAYQKLARSRKHLAELRFETKQFTSTEPFNLSGAYEPPDDHYVIRWRVRKAAPIRLGLIAGDVIHNMRSALDHLVYQLSIAGGGTGKRTQFPISEDEPEYDKWESVFLEGVGSTARATIRGLQPFHAKAAQVSHPSEVDSKSPLALALNLLAIGRLDNVDKHRTLFPITSVSPFNNPKFEGVTFISGTYPAPWILLTDGAEFFRVTRMAVVPGATEVKLTNPPPYTIVFGDSDFGPLGSPNDVWSDKTKGSVSVVDLSIFCDSVEQIIGMFVSEF